jgi:hypothetical protein
MAGNRLYFPVQAVLFYSGNAWSAREEGGSVDPNGYTAFGVQDVSITSNFSLTPVFQLGQMATYENVEGIPTVEVTLSKVLDGRELLWHLATMDAETPDLAGRIKPYCTFQLGLWPDDQARCFWTDGVNTVGANGVLNQTLADSNAGDGADRTANVTPMAVITCPEMYPSSLSYTINTTEGATENLTLTGSEKIWARAGRPTTADNALFGSGGPDWRFRAYADLRQRDLDPGADNQIASADSSPLARIAQGYNVILDSTMPTTAANRDTNGALRDPDVSVFPTEIPGINAFGLNPVGTGSMANENTYHDPTFARIQSVTFNVTLARNDITTLGYRLPIYKSVQMPVQVTTEITVVSTIDDGIAVESFSEACADISSLKASTIRLAICNGTPGDPEANETDNGVRLYAGKENKLTSVSYGQGGTGGGNVQATYSYQTNNDFTVLSSADPNTRADGWWNGGTTGGVTVDPVEARQRWVAPA